MKLGSRVLLLGWLLVAGAGVVAAQPCTTKCQDFKDKVAAERKEWIEKGWIYIAPGDPRSFLTIRSVPTNQTYPPVDDEVYVADRHYDESSGAPKATELWRRNYPNADYSLSRFTGSRLPKGRNELSLWYADTQPPNAHFFIALGGVAYCGDDRECRIYREGLTYGTGIVNAIKKQGGRGIVWSQKIYNSGLVPPERCTCDGYDPTFANPTK